MKEIVFTLINIISMIIIWYIYVHANKSIFQYCNSSANISFKIILYSSVILLTIPVIKIKLNLLYCLKYPLNLIIQVSTIICLVLY